MPAKNLYRDRKEGIYSHIYNKGVENRFVFNDEEDYGVFLGFLRDYLTPPRDPKSIKKSFTVNGRIFRGTPHQPKNYFNKVDLLAYLLMPGHFHLLLYQKDRGSVENFLRSLCTRYSMYFNKKYQRSGSLFDGPYKSIKIKDGPRLSHLTRYFHYVGGHSSYEEYLGTRETSWVKPKVVLSFFGKGGTGGYKDFVEKYEPAQKVKELLKGIIFESEAEHLERRDLAGNVENYPQEMSAQSSRKIHIGPNLKPWQRMPEVLAISVVFLLLTTFGVRNIMLSSAESLDSSIDSTVLSTTKEAKPEITQTVTKGPDPPTVPAVLSATEEIGPKMMLTVKIDDGAESVNIRQKPTTSSEKIGQAKDDDTFEYVSENGGWYEIKLATRSGFISATYIEEMEEINE